LSNSNFSIAFYGWIIVLEMVKNYAITFLGVVFCFLFACSAIPPKNTKTQIRVINNSSFFLSHVSLFSMTFGDLKPKDTSGYKELSYDPLRHDPLIYCIIEETNYGRYLKIPEESTKYYTYVVDSLNNGIIYVSSYAGGK